MFVGSLFLCLCLCLKSPNQWERQRRRSHTGCVKLLRCWLPFQAWSLATPRSGCVCMNTLQRLVAEDYMMTSNVSPYKMYCFVLFHFLCLHISVLHLFSKSQLLPMQYFIQSHFFVTKCLYSIDISSKALKTIVFFT